MTHPVSQRVCEARQPGFYWACREGDWEPAYWNGATFQVNGTGWPYREEQLKIDERRFERAE